MQLPSISDPSVFYILLCHAEGASPQCVLRQNPIGTNKDNWYFWTFINGKRTEFAPFGGHKLIDGTHWFECMNCDVEGTTLEVVTSGGHVEQFGVYVEQDNTPLTVTPEPATMALLGIGLIMLYFVNKLRRARV